MRPEFWPSQPVRGAAPAIALDAVENEFELCLREVVGFAGEEEAVGKGEDNEVGRDGDSECKCTFDSGLL